MTSECHSFRPIISEIVRVGYFTSHSVILGKLGYVLGDIIGEGAYCKVRVADQKLNPEKRLAVKIINRKQASKDFVFRFLPREIKILGEIIHPNIVQVHRIIDIGDNVYIFMDLAERGDMLEYIRTIGPIAEQRAKHFFSQLMDAIRYIHSKEITHRDLKCENILLFDDDVIKLTDFGFARKCIEPLTGKRVLSETYCGSAAYAAPEILEGTPYNPKMYDIWSLGCILFIMLTAQMPFDDSNIRRMLRHQQERKLRFSGMADKTLSLESKLLIRHMLEPDVCRRATLDQVSKHQWLLLTETQI